MDDVDWEALAERYERLAQPFTERFAVAALDAVGVGEGMQVLDVATGTGALALAAARAGATVLATDFYPGMVRRVLAHALPRLEARVMDGQALTLEDASFDAVFSMFGMFLFPDWRRGLAEMVRVARPGGAVATATWRTQGGGPNILLMAAVTDLFPDLPLAPMPAGVAELSDPGRLAAAMADAGLSDVSVASLTVDFVIERDQFEEPDRLFAYSPVWMALDAGRKAAVVARIGSVLADLPEGPSVVIPSIGLIAVGRRPN